MIKFADMYLSYIFMSRVKKLKLERTVLKNPIRSANEKIVCQKFPQRLIFTWNGIRFLTNLD